MEYEDKVRWLRRYLDAQRRERVLAEEVERLRAEAGRVTPLLSGPEKSVVSERVHTAQKALSDEIFRGMAVRQEIKQTIEAVSDMRFQEVLYRRYILDQTFEQISQKMLYELRWVKRLHHQAVDRLEV